MENDDLISVDGFVRWLDVGKYRNANEKCFSERDVAAMIKDFALTDSVDAVPVVRCKDCLHDFAAMANEMSQPMNNTQRKICEDAIQIFGVQHQLIKAAEELAELSQQVLKAANGDVDTKHIVEETADVEIMLEQLKIIFDRHVSVEAQVDYKLDRLQTRLNKYAKP